MFDSNNKNLGTQSIKLKKASTLISYIYDKLIHNQEICRYIKYNTKNPLAKVGTNYDGTKVTQLDLTASDMKELIWDIPFNPDTIMESKNGIYINLMNGQFNGFGNGLVVTIDVLTSIDYLSTSEGQRHLILGHKICDLFDNMIVSSKNESEYYEELGAIEPELYDFSCFRLSSTNKILHSRLSFTIRLGSLVQWRHYANI